ncbi:MAG: pyridoxamine 5'-phosphate oxidase family protein [Treponema sp.]|uniref:pyridoxamine 5'-phosphate oxidase family protein n=1 Tax=Treponema sp. TaxID=166 RepID=UPI0025E092B8|nr:pyridoxamine 5'-phosphate oxidase family protein [Treponema sp.]MBQ9281490.1 pyridoxamine 5'-phosphate oxidase family protein [Treponema sp.]
MFRQMRRFKQQVSEEKCIEILKNEWRGVLAVLGDDGYPYTIPLDFYYDEGDGKIYFHGAKEGHKVDAIEKCDKVSFCLMDKGFKKDGDWALNITSVVAFGRIKKVEDFEKVKEKVCKLGRKYHPSAEAVEIEWENAKNRVLCLEMTIEHMTGKLVNEK